MGLFLLDSDAVIDYLNQHVPTIALLEQLLLAEETLCTCGVVLAEVYAGLGPVQEEITLELLPSLQFLGDAPAIAEQAGRWRFEYSRRGRRLPVMDALVASTASHYRATVVTGNVRDYPMREVNVLPLPR